MITYINYRFNLLNSPLLLMGVIFPEKIEKKSISRVLTGDSSYGYNYPVNP